MTRLFPLLILLSALLAAPLAQAAPSPVRSQAAAAKPQAAAAGNRNVPTSINADRMEYDASNQVVRFTGNVHVKRPDFELWSVTMTVYLDKNAKPETGGSETENMRAGQIDRIVAETNVRMKSNDKEGFCQKATYYSKDDKIVMEGQPELHDTKRNSIKGREIIHHIATNRSEVKSPTVNFYAPDSTMKSTMPGTKNDGN